MLDSPITTLDSLLLAALLDDAFVASVIWVPNVSPAATSVPLAVAACHATSPLPMMMVMRGIGLQQLRACHVPSAIWKLTLVNLHVDSPMAWLVPLANAEWVPTSPSCDRLLHPRDSQIITELHVHYIVLGFTRPWLSLTPSPGRTLEVWSSVAVEKVLCRSMEVASVNVR